MMWDLPISVSIDGIEYKIRNKCDYRVVLDAISTLIDEEFEMQERLQCALFIFYENIKGCKDIEKAVTEMMRIINNGEVEEEQENNKPVLMDWKHDFKHIVAPISRVLGYDVRTPEKYTHWWTFLSGYMEIGECTFATIVSIRDKKAKGKKLEKWEVDFYRDNKKMVDLPLKLSYEEQKLLNSDW